MWRTVLFNAASAAETPGINPITMVLAVIAVVVSVIVAFFQWRMWKISGAHLTVKMGTMIVVFDSGNDAGQPPVRSMITIEVTNTGRAATTIQQWFLQNMNGPGGLGANGPDFTMGPRQPCKIESYEKVTWGVDLNEARARLLADADPDREVVLRAFVHYGPRTAKSKEVLPLAGASGTEDTGLTAKVNQIREKHSSAMMAHTIIGGGAATPIPYLGIYAIRRPLWLVKAKATARHVDRGAMSREQLKTLDDEKHSKLVVRRNHPWALQISSQMLTLADSFDVFWHIEWRGGLGRKHRSRSNGSAKNADLALVQTEPSTEGTATSPDVTRPPTDH